MSTSNSGSTSSIGREDLFLSESGSSGGIGREDRERVKRAAGELQTATSIFVFVLLIGLGALGWLGWIGTGKSIDLRYPTPALTAQVSNATEGQPTLEASPSPTLAPTPTPVASPSPTPTSMPIPQEAARPAAAQHFVTLSLLAAIAILFPGVLLLAFAFQQVPRLVKDLAGDLENLGLSAYPLLVEHEEIGKLASLIQSGFKPDFKNKDNLRPEELALQYVETCLDVTTGGKGYGGGHFLDLKGNPQFDQKVWADAWAATQAGNKRIIQAWQKWEEEPQKVKQQLSARYGWMEFLLPLLSLTLFVLASVVWTFWPEGIYGFVEAVANGANLHTYFSSVIASMSPALVAVLVAYLFMAYGLVRRYQRSDITPGAYWEVLKRLFVVFLLGLVISALIKADSEQASWASFGAILIGAFAGVFPIGTLGILSRGGQAWLQARLQKRVKNQVNGKDIQWGEDLAQSLRPQHDITLLDDIDQWDALRIEEEGVIGIQGMAEADMIHLVTWLPFPTSQIVDWVDQAILRLAAGAEPEMSYIKTLRAMGLRGASDLLDAAKDEEGKLTIVLAAQAVQGTSGDDPIPPAQLAALRAQLKVKDAQEKVDKVKGKKKDDNTADIAPALAAVRDAKGLVDDAHGKVKDGGDTLKDALDAANSLQAKFKTASEKADEVEKALKAVTDNKVSDGLETALKALGGKVTDEPDANSQAQALADALDKIANPLMGIPEKAQEFQQKAEAINNKAEAGKQDDVPQEVKDAATILTNLATLAQDAQKRIKADTSLKDATDKVDELVKLLTDEGEDKPKKLLGDEKLKKKEQWTTAVSDSDKKAKAYEDAQKLVTQAKDILSKAQDGEKAVIKARAKAAAAVGAAPVLTEQVLETILKGLERNPNLRRIQRYLTEETADIPKPREYTPNVGWLGG